MALISAVAFATVLAVVAGLAITASASIAHDVYNGVLHDGKSSEEAQVRVSRITVVVLGVVSVILGILAIGWNVLASLQRVALGFGLAAVVGIPAGFAIGRFEFMSRMFGPLISLLRPVSPLAWLPIGLLVFKGANPAAIWTIFICYIWPMIINTAVGVQRVPQDYMNVARVLNLSEWKIATKILFPAVLPYMLTGVRLAVGTAWLVIVAAEMLTGGVGIGFWVWDEWNNLNVQHILIAIFVIGIVGLLLEQALVAIAKRFSFE